MGLQRRRGEGRASEKTDQDEMEPEVTLTRQIPPPRALAAELPAAVSRRRAGLPQEAQNPGSRYVKSRL